MARVALVVLLIADAVAAAHARALSRSLPPVVASPFNAAGQANGWMPRGAFIGVYLGLVAFLTLCFVAASFAMRSPGARINLPHRDYWLAPERRDDTLAWISAWSYWMGTAVVLLITSVMELAARVNRGALGAMGTGAPRLLVAFGAVAAVMLAVMTLHFRSPPE